MKLLTTYVHLLLSPSSGVREVLVHERIVDDDDDVSSVVAELIPCIRHPPVCTAGPHCTKNNLSLHIIFG